MRQDLVAIGQSTPAASAGHRHAGPSWRHLATALLLALLLPVLLVAGAAALVVLPLALAVVGFGQTRQLLRSLHPGLPAGASH
ncbi:hypothetical protein [Piscinibacter sp.]|uniref:hypothetical protein n=1 Tax=Piscinibacter sp. TaxID=1903157 RepID=UPI0039E6F182